MANEFDFSRREDGLTIRFLAQCLINDIIFPNQKGINDLISKATGGTINSIILDNKFRWEYWFLFHLEDFGSNDKSEIDILLRKGDYLFPIEIKAFTNPNETNVKREIVRNYLALKKISQKQEVTKFDDVKDIFPILLYSKPIHLKRNPSGKDFDYFNKSFLIKKSVNQKDELRIWNTSKMKYEEDDRCIYLKAQEISKKLLFITWDNVYEVLKNNNENNIFNKLIYEIENKYDYYNKVFLLS
jgi:hypothetical protein